MAFVSDEKYGVKNRFQRKEGFSAKRRNLRENACNNVGNMIQLS
jgi:hypothetical protein